MSLHDIQQAQKRYFRDLNFRKRLPIFFYFTIGRPDVGMTAVDDLNANAALIDTRKVPKADACMVRGCPIIDMLIDAAVTVYRIVRTYVTFGRRSEKLGDAKVVSSSDVRPRKCSPHAPCGSPKNIALTTKADKESRKNDRACLNLPQVGASCAVNPALRRDERLQCLRTTRLSLPVIPHNGPELVVRDEPASLRLSLAVSLHRSAV
ncbi:hypothetical protein Q3G72_019856 [Acer saccharum]|nr:hypothetical protein Q3G72_019856 [Acer saccharum]